MERASRTEGEREPIEARRRRRRRRRRAVTASFSNRLFAFSGAVGLGVVGAKMGRGEEACGRGGIEIGLARLVRPSPIVKILRDLLCLCETINNVAVLAGCPSREPNELT